MIIENKSWVLASCIFSLGLLGSGFLIGKGFSRPHFSARTVTVKGLAEKKVRSNLGIWEINYREIGNDLTELEKKINEDQMLVRAFLQAEGFSSNEIDVSNYKIEDRLANTYGQSSTKNNDTRYIMTSGLRIRSTNVDKIKKASESMNTLLQKNIPLTFDASMVSPNPSYYYTTLDAIRPSMISDATASAQAVAVQFANDAKMTLNGIQRASQGQFQIMSSDTNTLSSDWSSNQSALGSIDKAVRIVTTIEYRLK